MRQANYILWPCIADDSITLLMNLNLIVRHTIWCQGSEICEVDVTDYVQDGVEQSDLGLYMIRGDTM